MLHSTIGRLLTFISLIALSIVLLACEPGPTVKFNNDTEDSVKVYQRGELVYELAPGKTRQLTTRKRDWISQISVVSSDGTVLFERTITWDDLEAMDYQISVSNP